MADLKQGDLNFYQNLLLYLLYESPPPSPLFMHCLQQDSHMYHKLKMHIFKKGKVKNDWRLRMQKYVYIENEKAVE